MKVSWLGFTSSALNEIYLLEQAEANDWGRESQQRRGAGECQHGNPLRHDATLLHTWQYSVLLHHMVSPAQYFQ